MALPAGSGIERLEELHLILQNLEMSIDVSEEPPSDDFATLFLQDLEPRDYWFELPIGWSGQPVEGAFGGRYNLALVSTTLAGTSGPRSAYTCSLKGTLQAGHWIVARRRALEVAEEALGLLAACSVVDQSQPLAFGQTREEFPDTKMTLGIAATTGGDGEPSWQRQFQLSWSERAEVNSVWFGVPQHESDLELAEERLGRRTVLDIRLHEAMKAFVVGGEDSKRIRRAARFLKKAILTQSPGDSYLFMATCLESLLVEGSGDLSARVADAVAMSIARSREERSILRALATHVYEVRSRYVHGGVYAGSELKRHDSLAMACRVVRNEARLP